MDTLHRELRAICDAGVLSLLRTLHSLESIPESELTPELREWRQEQRATLREDLMKVTRDEDGRRLRRRIEEFARSLRELPRAG